MSKRIIGMGEVLWDLLPAGKQLGGAPANVALHARALGADAALVSRVGDDEAGRDILRRLDDQGLPGALVQTDPSAPTGTVTVELRGKGIPHYTIHEGVAWDRIAATPEALAAVAGADAVCFGSLAQRHPVSRAAIRKLVGHSPESALRVFDINLRQHYFTPETLDASLQLANVLKLNDAELPLLAGQCGLTGAVENQLEALAARFGLKVIAFTRGAQGSLLWQEGRRSERRGPDVKVVDTVGAGDSFTATMVMGLLRGMDLDETNERANAVASFVCSQPGATPPLPQEFRQPFAI